MATRNAVLSRKHLIPHGPSRHHFLQGAISSSYFAEGNSGGKERLVPGEVHYLPIDGHPNVCDCEIGTSCVRCNGQHMLVMRIIGIVNTDMFGRSYIFFAVVANESDIRRLENIEVWKDEPMVRLSGREQLVYGVYDPSRKPRGWMAPCPLTLEQLHSSLLAGAIGSDDMRTEPAKLKLGGFAQFPGTKTICCAQALPSQHPSSRARNDFSDQRRIHCVVRRCGRRASPSIRTLFALSPRKCKAGFHFFCLWREDEGCDDLD